jgi:hypothetical protein
MATKNALFNYEQQFYLNNTLLSGVTNIDGSYSVSQEPINIIGKGYVYPVRQGPMVGNFSIQKYYVGKDPLLNYIGEVPIKASINYGEQSIGFNNGFLTEYSFSAGIGQIPQAQASINVYGDIGKGISAKGSTRQPDIQIPNQGSILINSKNYETNRVSRFDYTIRINRNPVYKIGTVEPVQVNTQYPIFQELSLEMDLNDYELTKLKDFIKKPYQQDLNIILNNPVNNSLIEEFTIKNARIVSHSFNSANAENTTVNLTYNGYINREDRKYFDPPIFDITNDEGVEIFYFPPSLDPNELFEEDRLIERSTINNSVNGYIMNPKMNILEEVEFVDDFGGVETDTIISEVDSEFLFWAGPSNLITGIKYYSPDKTESIIPLPISSNSNVLTFDTSLDSIILNEDSNFSERDIEKYYEVVNILKSAGVHKIDLL